jgi:FkbM family methyltransferase
VAFDIGANAGYWTLPLAQISRRVIAFEPDPNMRGKLVHNLALNPGLAGKVAVREQAVSETSGEATLHIRRVVDGDALVNTGISSLISSTYLQSDCTVPTLALDDIAEEFDDARIGFIKIDVEGAESLAIRGALRTLRRHAPLLHWEAAYSLDEAASSSNCDETLSLLNDCGYAHFAVLNDASTRPICTADDLRDVGYDVNILSTTGAAQVPPRLMWLGR